MSENEAQRNAKINRIRVENVFLLLIIVTLFVSLQLNKQNIEFLKKGIEQIPKNIQKQMLKKAKTIAWIFVLAAIWFLYTAYKDYEEDRNQARINYLIAAAILLISSGIRLYSLYKYSNVQISGAEDYAL